MTQQIHGKVFKNVALSYDDVLIRPDHSSVTKDDLNVTPRPIGKLGLRIPIISSCMDTVTELPMIDAMRKVGGTGIYHRYTRKHLLAAIIAKDPLIPAAVGTWKSHEDVIRELIMAGCRYFVIDVAHGDSQPALDTIQQIKQQCNGDVIVIAGNIATPSAASRVIRAGADGARVGIGGGSACITRMVTGCGTPTLQSILDIRHDFPELLILADGGIRSGGDLAKAIGAGADYVILGGMLAGTDESPGDIVQKVVNGGNKRFKLYRGMASYEAQVDGNGKLPGEVVVEGDCFEVEYVGPVAGVIKDLVHGLKQAMHYVGAANLEEFYENCFFQPITHNGLMEGTAHRKSR